MPLGQRTSENTEHTSTSDLYLGLGSNIGNRVAHFTEAKGFISKHIGLIKQSSTIIESSPWGTGDQAAYLNQVILVETQLSVYEAFELILTYQNKIRSKDYEKWGPRKIDIDLLYYDNDLIFGKNLIIPHPYIEERKFVLYSLSEIVSDQFHPILRISHQELLNNCKDTGTINPFNVQDSDPI